MAGAVINSLRFELQDTGEMPYRRADKGNCADCGGAGPS